MVKAKIISNLDAHAATGQNARIIARVRLEEMYNWEHFVDDPYAIHELHNLRIAAKRLRYTLEIFSATFPDQVKDVLKEVEQIQGELGNLHDSDVMVALLRLFLGGLDGGTGYEQALLSLVQHPPKGSLMVDPELVAHVLQASAAPQSLQRKGLELLLSNLHQQREDQYAAFHKHWYQLRSHDFRQTVFALLSDE
jgi:hypothetical protein